jgi:hypothetical protein
MDYSPRMISSQDAQLTMGTARDGCDGAAPTPTVTKEMRTA